jgi:hypothetical protein
MITQYAYRFFSCGAQQPYWGIGRLIIEVSRSHSDTPLMAPSQRPVPDNTQHSQETDIYALGEIRTHNPSKRAAADPHFKRRGHRNRPMLTLRVTN